MGKPMVRYPISHYKNPKEPLVGSTKPTKQVRSAISAPPGCSIFNQPVEVQKVVKPEQDFLKTWSRANEDMMKCLVCNSEIISYKTLWICSIFLHDSLDMLQP
jgi:hypothetical protein